MHALEAPSPLTWLQTTQVAEDIERKEDKFQHIRCVSWTLRVGISLCRMPELTGPSCFTPTLKLS